MARNAQSIRARIASIQSTRKITGAMQLVAAGKLNKQKDAMNSNKEYSSALFDLMHMVLAQSGKDSIYLQDRKDLPSYIFIITSDLGLCGSYNVNLFHLIREQVKENDIVVMVGARGISWMNANGMPMKKGLAELHEDNAYSQLAMQAEDALEAYESGKVGKIRVLYTQYKNTLTFEPVMETILPVKKTKEESPKAHPLLIYEPSKAEMLNELIPMVVKSLLFSHYLEAHTSEQASRRMAMESATENADRLVEDLKLDYNRARQAAITQEITEIVGGANALD